MSDGNLLPAAEEVAARAAAQSAVAADKTASILLAHVDKVRVSSSYQQPQWLHRH